MTSDSGSRVRTTETSLDIVEAVKELGGARTTDLAAELGLAKSTVHKHAKTLERRGYLRSRNGIYHVGLKFLNLGESARTRWPTYNHIEETVRSLHTETDEDVDFVAEEQGRVYTICESYHKWEKYPDAQTGYRVHLGDQYYMHSVASGKAILSTFDRDDIERIVERWGLPRFTENTITDEAALFDELERIAEQGYAIGDEEFVNGLRSIARPVFLPDGSVLGALSVSGPAYRMSGAVLEEEIMDTHRRAVESLEARIEEEFPDNIYERRDSTPRRDGETSSHTT